MAAQWSAVVDALGIGDSATTAAAVAAVAAVAVAVAWWFTRRGSRKGKGDADLKPGVVHVRLFPRSKYAVSLSPFNIKLETWLRIAKIPYDLKHTTKTSPKGKSPWIVYNGHAMGDSALIIDFLTREFKVQLDAHLTPDQHAIGHAVRTMLEERTYFVGVYGRWVEGFHNVFKYIIPIPWPMQVLISPLIKRRINGALMGQGIGRHTPAEIHAFARKDLEAVAQILGTKPYLLGDRVTTYDASVFGILGNFYHCPFNPPEKTLLHTEFPTLQAYILRIKADVFPDWDELCATARA